MIRFAFYKNQSGRKSQMDCAWLVGKNHLGAYYYKSGCELGETGVTVGKKWPDTRNV